MYVEIDESFLESILSWPLTIKKIFFIGFQWLSFQDIAKLRRERQELERLDGLIHYNCYYFTSKRCFCNFKKSFFTIKFWLCQFYSIKLFFNSNCYYPNY